MKKIIVIFLLGILFVIPVFSQNEKKQVVAVWVMGNDEDIALVLADQLVSAISVSDTYVAVERSADFLNAISEEIDYQTSGAVDDRQIAELGRQYGATYVCAAKISSIANTNYISVRLINVETALIKKTANTHNKFESIEAIVNTCEDLAYQLLGVKSKAQLSKEQYIEEKKKKEEVYKTKRDNHPFFLKKRNSYLAISGETGYPLTFGLNFMGRHGNIIGIGYSLSLGGDLYGSNDETYDFMSYSLSLKFLYQSAYLMGGYGTFGCEKVSQFNDSEGRWGLDGVRQREGYFLMIGYDILGNLSKKDGNNIFCSVSAGMSYDTFMKDWNPLIRFKVGFGWGI